MKPGSMTQQAPDARSIVVFRLDDRSYGLWLSSVERVLRMVEITPLPRAPAIMAGVIDVGGEPIPVVEVRRRLKLPLRPWSIDDQLVVARALSRRIALLVDSVIDVRDVSLDDLVMPGQMFPGHDCIDGVVRLPEGLALLHDLDAFLSPEEEAGIARILDGGA